MEMIINSGSTHIYLKLGFFLPSLFENLNLLNDGYILGKNNFLTSTPITHTLHCERAKSSVWHFFKPERMDSPSSSALTYEVCFGDGSLGMALSEDLEVLEIDEGGQAWDTKAIREGDVLQSIAGKAVSTLDDAAPILMSIERPMVLEFIREDSGGGHGGFGKNVLLNELRGYFGTIEFLGKVEEFCLDHCDSFDDEEEMLLIYTDIHRQFTDMFEEALLSFLEKRGVPIEEFFDLCKHANAQNEAAEAFLDMIHASFQFDSFVELMRNQKRKKDALGDPRLLVKVDIPRSHK